MIPARAAARIRRLLDAADTRLGDLIEAVWVEGSIALGDFHPRKSDIDLVLLTRRELMPRERVAIHGRPPLQVAWMTRERCATLAACDGGIGAVEGRIVSKCAAVRLVRDCFDPRWHRILDEALRLRLGGPSLYRSPFERRRDMVAFVEHAIERTRLAG